MLQRPWVEGNWKLHRFEKRDGEVTWNLYDLASDPRESTDLWKAQPDRGTALRGSLETWMRDVVGSLNGEDYSP